MKFLKRVAEDIYRRFDGDLHNVTVVFPGKRAGLFFNRYLAEISDRAIWSPSYLTVTELYESLSDYDIADPLLLIYHLYAAYTEACIEQQSQTGSSDSDYGIETLDSFFNWGEVMLSDFDDIDKNLSDAKAIFSNMKDLDALTSLDYLTKDQIDAIEHYFGVFDKDRKTRLKEKFMTIWNLLYPTYDKFKHRLESSGIAYEGMLCRSVTEKSVPLDRLRSGTYIFVGFNVLTATDHRLYNVLKSEGKALFYWDFDKSYVNASDKGHTFFEAGRSIEANISQFGNAFDLNDACYDNMGHKKEVTYVSSPTDNSQMRYACEWLGDNVTEDLTETAVVLCKPNMLQGMTHSIPDPPEGESPYKINVTMGFPLSNTPICSFISALLDLQVYGNRGFGWAHSYVSNVLRHPYSNRMTSNHAIEKYDIIRKQNILFVNESFFNDDEVLSLLFKPQSTTRDLIGYLSEVIRILGSRLFKNDEHDNHLSVSDFDDQLNRESVYKAFTVINRFSSVMEQVATKEYFAHIRSNEMSKEQLSKLLQEVLRGQSVPFHGEPAEGIQILGLLDTRNIDFKHVIMLGVNDENLPQNIHQASFIPYTLREAHGMTTLETRSCIHAYSFYRLIQRAEHVTMVYNNSTDGLSKGDMSRYMTQLLVEQDRILNSDSRIRQISLESHVEPQKPYRLSVEKNSAIFDILKKKYHILDNHGNVISNPNDIRFFSPSAINSYISCPMKFYLNYIAGIKVEDELTDEVGNDVFGTIFHYCMENIYRPYIGKVLQASLLESWIKNKQFVRHYVDEGFREKYFKTSSDTELHYNGEQWLNHEVIVRYVEKQLKYDFQLCPLRIDGVENKEHHMDIDIHGMRIRLGGIIDRIDTIRVGIPGKERHRIVDYKTSSTKESFKDLSELTDSTKSGKSHIFQAFYYSDIYTEDCAEAVAPSLMYIKPAEHKIDADKEEKSIICCDKTPITDFKKQLKDNFHSMLLEVLNEIFDDNIPFVQTSNKSACKWCDYKDLCRKKIVES